MRTVAYLDAGSGSVIASAIVAGGAGIVVLFKRREAKEAKEARLAPGAPDEP